MSNKKLGLVLLSVALVIIVGFGVFKLTSKKASAPATSTTSTNSTDTSNKAAAQTQTFTSEEVKAHSTSEDCWTIISGKVYNITEYIPNHPGGKEILRACGTDATTLFTTRTTADGQKVGSGTGHSDNASNQLNKFLVGSLKQ